MKAASTPSGSYQSWVSRSWVLPWSGFAVGLCLIIPTLLHAGRRGWIDFDVPILVAGIVLVIVCATRLAIILGRFGGAQARDEDSGVE